MANFIIKLEEEDIQTYFLGTNFAVEAKGVTLIFSPEAIKELVEDWQNLEAQQNTPSEELVSHDPESKSN